MQVGFGMMVVVAMLFVLIVVGHILSLFELER